MTNVRDLHPGLAPAASLIVELQNDLIHKAVEAAEIAAESEVDGYRKELIHAAADLLIQAERER